MNFYFLAASIVSFVVGFAHSLLGELLVFRRLRTRGIVPANGGQLLSESNVRILWATWHATSVFGGCMAVLLWRLALPPPGQLASEAVAIVITIAMCLSSLLVLIGTKGRHPGWVGLLAVAVLTALGQYS